MTKLFLQARRWRWEAPASARGRGGCWRRRLCSRLTGLAASATQVRTLLATDDMTLSLPLLYGTHDINHDIVAMQD